MTIEKRITKARTTLLLDYPWFGSLAMNLRIEPNDSIPTFDVDGTVMRYNPEFADSLKDAELAAVIAHEVMHCALLHIYRREGRDAQQWNEAADYAINLELTNAGLQLPKGCLLDNSYAGLSAEVIYAQLGRKRQQQPKQGQSGQGQGQSQQQPTGTFSDAPKDDSSASDSQGNGNPNQKPNNGSNGQQSTPSGMSETDWKVAAEQAARVAKAAGKMSGSLERTLQNARKSIVDWRQELREFIEQTVPSDYSWQSPNRRYIQYNVYLPSVTKEGFGTLAIGIDTSGSIDERVLSIFAAELNSICSDLKPEKVVILYCDAEVKNVQECAPDEEIKFKPAGGGGTLFQPVFDAVNKWEEPPKALLYFTDMYNGDSQLTEPSYPVLWVTGLDCTVNEPFGRMIRIDF